jgi:hypothetical protein
MPLQTPADVPTPWYEVTVRLAEQGAATVSSADRHASRRMAKATTAEQALRRAAQVCPSGPPPVAGGTRRESCPPLGELTVSVERTFLSGSAACRERPGRNARSTKREVQKDGRTSAKCIAGLPPSMNFLGRGTSGKGLQSAVGRTPVPRAFLGKGLAPWLQSSHGGQGSPLAEDEHPGCAQARGFNPLGSGCGRRLPAPVGTGQPASLSPGSIRRPALCAFRRTVCGRRPKALGRRSGPRCEPGGTSGPLPRRTRSA